MPQLEQIDSFTSQIFWLFVAFGFLYFFVLKFITPKLSGVVESRNSSISKDFEDAENFKIQAEKNAEALEKKLQSSKIEAQEKISLAVKDSTKLYNESLAMAEAKIKEESEIAEKDILNTKDAVLDDLRKQSASFVEEIIAKIVEVKIERSAIEKALSVR